MTTAEKISFLSLPPSAQSPKVVSILGDAAEVAHPVSAKTRKNLILSSPRENTEVNSKEMTNAPKTSAFSSLVNMVSMLLSLQVALTNTYTKKTECAAEMSKKTLEFMREENEKAIANMRAAEAEAEKAGILGKWTKGIGIALFAVVALGTLAFMGPFACALTIGLFVLCETGQMDSWVNKIAAGIGADSKLQKLMIKIALCTAIAAAGAGASSALDTAAASATESAASTVAEESVSALESEAYAGFSATFRASFDSTFTTTLLQTFMQMNVFTEQAEMLADQIYSNSTFKLVLGIALNLAAMVAIGRISEGVAIKSAKSGVANAGMVISTNIARAAKTSILAKALNSVYQNNPTVIARLSQLLGGVNSGLHIWAGKIRIDQADITKELGPIQALIQKLEQVTKSTSQWMQENTQSNNASMKSLGAMIENFAVLTHPTARAAEILA